jgi:hypothetical protein
MNEIERKRIEVPIKKTLSNENMNISYEFSINKSFFDPSKGSPPNDFMLKLEQRIKFYCSSSNLETFDSE